jgi:hypothetical protein
MLNVTLYYSISKKKGQDRNPAPLNLIPGAKVSPEDL